MHPQCILAPGWGDGGGLLAHHHNAAVGSHLSFRVQGYIRVISGLEFVEFIYLFKIIYSCKQYIMLPRLLMYTYVCCLVIFQPSRIHLDVFLCVYVHGVG